MQENLRIARAEQFERTRLRTLEIFDSVEEPILHQSPGFGFRPILWHLAHFGAFEEYWLLQNLTKAAQINERFQIIFDPIKTPRESSKNLPSKAEMIQYLEKVRSGVLKVLEIADFDPENPLLRDGYVFDLVHQHELQHQETLAYLFHLLPLAEVQSLKSKVQSLPENRESKVEAERMKVFAAGDFQFGASGGEFVYDNEIPAHNRFVPAFKLDARLTSNAEFADFIAEQGYKRREFWSEEGWQHQEKENWNAPVYWRKNENDWLIRAFAEEKSLSESADYPVYGVSFYEAEAYANFRGKRLPNEFELECAALSNVESSTENCNFGFKFWNTTPVDCFGQRGGMYDLGGNLWEWTTSDFAAYPNFKAFPYPEYSEEWFDGDHKVLRGGSWATSEEILRPTFRNFFRRHFRIAFAGIRLAENV
jgi:iron(II)-dependent oxidoreductase